MTPRPQDPGEDSGAAAPRPEDWDVEAVSGEPDGDAADELRDSSDHEEEGAEGEGDASEELGELLEGPDPESGAALDHEFVRRAQTGDEDAFAGLVRRHQDRAYRVARNLVPNREDALDLAQEAFLRVYKNLDRFDFRHEFTTWLYRIVTNLCIDHLRKRRPAVSTSGNADDDDPGIDLPDSGDLRPGADLEREETRARVREVIDSLAPHFRAVLVLRELEGLPCTEIARIVGATHVTVRWRLHRGRKLFQEEWERLERLAAARFGGALSAPPTKPSSHS